MASVYLLVACLMFCGQAYGTINADQGYVVWPDKANIPYYFDASLSAAEQTMVKKAITAVQASLNQCVRFKEVPSTSAEFKIKFTSLIGGPGSQPQSFCFTNPGLNVALKQISREQVLSLAHGPTGCLDAPNADCLIQKYIASVLGKRNEHQRGDRDTFITVSQNLPIPSAYRKYTTTEAFWSPFPYDYCSITHNQPSTYAASATVPAFTIPPAMGFTNFPSVCELSLTDCKLISKLYNCDASACTQAPCTYGPGQSNQPSSPIQTVQKQQVVAFLKSLQTGATAPLDAINAYKLIEHDLGGTDGKAGFIALQQITSKIPTTSVNTVRVFQDGDYVFTHTDYDFFGPKVGFDVVRFEDGQIVEHWDNLQVKPAVSPNAAGHTMLDGPTQARDLGKTAANKALVRKYVQDVVVEGKKAQVLTYFNGGQYIQHNPLSTGDGLAATAGLVASLPVGTNVCSRIRQVLGEGDFVLVMCDGTWGTNATAFYDLYRVENGKIAEHWDTIQQIPPFSEWKNLNGKF